MIVSGRNVWKRNESFRKYYLIVLDTISDEDNHVAYICKCCWKYLDAAKNHLSLQGHILEHENRQEQPYSQSRPGQMTVAEVLTASSIILENFEKIIPPAGTWKLECKTCGELFPHRTAYKNFIDHALKCRKKVTFIQ